jgi:hypothetical protein
MPFALLLFTTSCEQLERPATKRILAITLLVVINILIKPSFFFSFCVVFPVFLLKQYSFKKSFWLNLVPVVVGLILVWVEYFLLFVDDSGSGLTIGFFNVWVRYTKNIPLSFLGSVFFPLIYTIFYWKDLKKDLLYQYSVALFFVAILLFSLVTQKEQGKFHGNFGWQYIITNYLLYMVIVTRLLWKTIRDIAGEILNLRSWFVKLNWQNKILLVTYSFQFLLGVYYLVQTIITRNYKF